MLKMMKGLALVVPSVMMVTASAAEMPGLKLEMRGDLVKNSSDNDLGTGLSPNDGNKQAEAFRFSMPYSRLKVSGKYNDQVSYAAKFRLNKVPAAVNDGSVSSLDYIYIDHALTEAATLRIGKQGINMGGWEADRSSKDVYTYSLVGDSTVDNPVGVGLTYTFGDHSVNFQLANNSFEQTNTSTFLYGFQFVGSFMNGLVQPLISYHIDNATKQDAELAGGGTAAPKFANKWLAVGVRTKHEGLMAEIDYLKVDMENQTNTAGDTDDEDTSIVFNIEYRIDKLRPQLKYAMSESKDDGTKAYERTDYSLALEYFPFENDNINYHVAYKVCDTDISTNTAVNPDVKTSQLIVGFAGSF